MTTPDTSSLWGPLAYRYEKKQARKILSLDGGGIRGVITLEILSKIEKDLKTKLKKGDDFRLSDYFDYFGGTSTGAIIAAGLSIGMSVDELLRFYEKEGRNMFIKGWMFWKYKYSSGPLRRMMQKVFGKNPLAKYNNKDRPDNNQIIKLYQLVRASTAAPSYFPAETVHWDPKDPSKTFVFVDGGVTPYNNPAFLLYRMATLPAYKLNWERGEDQLLIVSVGTGSATKQGSYGHLLNLAKRIPEDLMYAMGVDQDINCRTVGRCTYGPPIDRELLSMIPGPEELPTNRDFLYVRYNADLSSKGLKELGLDHLDSARVRKMDKADNIPHLRSIGAAAAESQVNLDHFESFA